MLDPLINYHNLLRMARSSGWPNTQMYQPSFGNQQFTMGGPPGTPWHGQSASGPRVSPMLPQRKPRRRGRLRAIRQSRGMASAMPMQQMMPSRATTMFRPGFRPVPFTRPFQTGAIPTQAYGRPWINDQYANLIR